MTMHHSNRPRIGVFCLAIVLAVGGLMMSGCDDGGGFVLSLEPSYTPTDLESDQALLGAWTTTEGDTTLNFEQGERQKYKVVLKEKDEGRESSAEFEAHLVRLGAIWFIDFLPNGKAGGSEFYQMHLLRAHSIARIELSQDTLQIAFLDATWLEKKIDEKAVDISHRKIDGMLLLTGTTEEVQDLLFQYENDDGAFPDPTTLTRQEMQP